jgi:K+-sensing histidine kinase KdpD
MDPLIAPLGAMFAVGLAAVLSPLRDTSFGNTNAALVLVVVIAAAASMGGRGAGALCAISAALSYNFFFTRPYQSLHINDTKDVVTVLLLLGVGLVVGEFARSRGRNLGRIRRHAESAHRLERVAGILATESSIEQLCDAVCAEVEAELNLAEAHWAPELATGRPVMERSGWVPATIHRHSGDGFELPADGVDLPVSYAGARLGTLVLVPQPDTGVSVDQRRVALALADLLASGLARGQVKSQQHPVS